MIKIIKYIQIFMMILNAFMLGSFIEKNNNLGIIASLIGFGSFAILYIGSDIVEYFEKK